MGRHNQITYQYFCILGGLAHPRCRKVHRYNGTHHYITYHLVKYV